MAKEFRLPDIGEGLTEAEIVSWRVAVGGEVAVDQPLVEIETDKAVIEIPSPFAGVVLRRGALPGEVLEVGQVLAVIGEPGEDGDAAEAADAADTAETSHRPGSTAGSAPPIVGSLVEEAQDLTRVASAGAATPARRPQAVPRARKLAEELGVDLATVAGTGPGGRITSEDVEAAAAVGRPAGSHERHLDGKGRVLSPLVRRLASERGVDLGGVTGTGPGGRITRNDVAAAAPPGRRDADVVAAGGDQERRPLSRLRRTIAANMSRSWSEIPQVTAFDEVDATRLLAVRRALQHRHGQAVPIDALLVAAVVPALEVFPELNASLDGDHLLLHRRHDVGVAVATPEGLMVATVRDAGSKDVLQLADEILALGERARARTLSAEELSGQTFTVSNVGAVGGGGHGTPLVPAGTVGILSVGRATEKPVAREGRLDVAPVMPLSLSYDHRVVDGADGRRFLALLIENLVEPALFLARG